MNLIYLKQRDGQGTHATLNTQSVVILLGLWFSWGITVDVAGDYSPLQDSGAPPPWQTVYKQIVIAPSFESFFLKPMRGTESTADRAEFLDGTTVVFLPKHPSMFCFVVSVFVCWGVCFGYYYYYFVRLLRAVYWKSHHCFESPLFQSPLTGRWWWYYHGNFL